MIAILGAGESGVGAAILAKRKGIQTFVSDKNQIKPKYLELLKKYNIEFEQGKHSQEKILTAKEIIKSPGIPETIPILQKAKAKNISIISEIEFASRYTNATFIAITGSNGKTTTSTLIYEILKKAGYDVALTGNVGKSLAFSLANRDYKYFVIELSSFQLDNCYTFNPKIAILLNITADHLDRYEYKLENYIKSKFRLIQNHSEEDFFIFWKQDKNIDNYLKTNSIKSKLLTFTLSYDKSANAYIEKNQVIINFEHKRLTFNEDDLKIKGKHNLLNAMAASLAALLVNVPEKSILQTIKTFSGIEHRLEFVTTINGVSFINDSKATNVNSVRYALDAIQKPVILILGGIDKGNDYSLIKELVKEKVTDIIALGLDNEKIIKAFGKIKPIYEVKSIEHALEKAFSLSQPGYSILLSPACASFDLFQNYIDRGNQFKNAILNLKQKVYED